MIALTRLNGTRFVVNAELIKTVEQTPDTVITLLNGDRLLVREPIEQVVQKAIEYGRAIRSFSVPP